MDDDSKSIECSKFNIFYSLGPGFGKMYIGSLAYALRVPAESFTWAFLIKYMFFYCQLKYILSVESIKNEILVQGWPDLKSRRENSS